MNRVWSQLCDLVSWCACLVGPLVLGCWAQAARAQTASVEFADFSNVSDWQLNGAAAKDGDRIRLTPSDFTKAGGAFLSQPLSFDADYSFQSHFVIQISDPGSNNNNAHVDVDGTGGDGMAFVIQNDSRGAFALGGAGGALGVKGISRHVSVAFDTWHTGDFDWPGNWNNNGNHIEIDTHLSSMSLAQTDPLPRFTDGDILDVWVEYDGAAGLLSVYYVASESGGADQPAEPTLSAAVDFDEAFNGATDLYVGFTAGTWSAFATHEVIEFQFGEMTSGGLPPIAVCQSATIAADDSCEGFVEPFDVDGGSSDPDGGELELTLSYAGAFPLGATEVTLTVTNLDSESDTCGAVVTVVDGAQTPPAITCPDELTVWPTSPEGAEVLFEVTAEDNCDPQPLVSCTQSSGSFFPMGATMMNCTAVDMSGNVDACSFDITVLTIEDVIDASIDAIGDLVDEGILGSGQGNALVSKLTASARSFARGRDRTACNQLGALVNQIHGLRRAGDLTAEEADGLIELVDVLLAAGGCDG